MAGCKALRIFDLWTLFIVYKPSDSEDLSSLPVLKTYQRSVVHAEDEAASM
jgi:hypothetical protein